MRRIFNPLGNAPRKSTFAEDFCVKQISVDILMTFCVNQICVRRIFYSLGHAPRKSQIYRRIDNSSVSRRYSTPSTNLTFTELTDLCEAVVLPSQKRASQIRHLPRNRPQICVRTIFYLHENSFCNIDIYRGIENKFL